MDEFESLYREYYPRVFAYLLNLSNDPDLSEELTQETFFRVFRKIDDYRGDSKFYTWACGIARNAYIDHLRREKHRHRLSQEELESIPVPGVEESAVIKDTAERIRIAIHTLPEPYRTVCRMRLLEERSYDYIAKVHSRSQSWARVTCHRGRIMIQELIK